MQQDEIKFTVMDDDGNPIECGVLFTFEDDRHRNFIVYTDNVMVDGSTRVLASLYTVTEQQELSLAPITADEDWALVEDALQRTYDEVINGAFGAE